MAFNGVFPAAEVVPAPCGLLSVATAIDHTGRDELWVGGYDVTATANPTVRIRSALGGDIADGEISTHDSAIPTHFPVVPFFIELEIKSSGLNILYDDPLGNARPQIEAATQKAVERELWEGLSAQDAGNDNIFLRAATGAQVLTSGPVHPKRGLAILEEAISNSATGGAGTLHMTRGTASSIVGGGLSYIPDPDDQTKGALLTSLGTPVIVGSGYTGNGPLGVAGTEATATNKWMYVTGPVTVHLGEVEVSNDSLRQGFISSTNDSIIRAYRPAAVHFDPTVFYAVQVTLPDVP